jgi:DNA-binding NtrC family response regulator
MSDFIHILLVEDDVALLGVMEESLAQEDRRIQVAHRAEHALEMIAQNDYDLVISDYDLKSPAANGLDVIRRAREKNSATIGVMITAYVSMPVSLEAIRLGAYDFIAKPFQIEELRLTVRNAAETIRLRAANDELRGLTSELSASLKRLTNDYDALMNEMRALKERLIQVVNLGPAATAAARAEALQQLQTYGRMGESRREQLAREGLRVKTLIDEGAIDEPVLEKWLASRKETLAR